MSYFHFMNKDKFKLVILLLFHIFMSNKMMAQVTVESHYVLALPFEPLKINTNRDGIFGPSFGIYYKAKKFQKLTFGLQFRHLPYAEGSNFDLSQADNVYIGQESRSKVQMQSFNGVIRGWLTKETSWILPYIECLFGFKRLNGYTLYDKGFFTADTDGDGLVNSFDEPIDLNEWGITTTAQLPKSRRQSEHSQLTPSLGIGIGIHFRIIKNLKLNTGITYLYSPSTTYYDFGSERMFNNRAGIEGFRLVESEIAFISIFAGLSYTF